jgi:hypothetical protein
MVIKGHYNPKRNSNLDLWKWYLTEENLEYAQDPFWQDLVWDIPVSYLQERGNFGIGKIAALKPGVLDKLRDDVEFENIDLPKAYRKLVQQLAASSEEDLPREWNNKTWVYLPSMDEDPKNYDANVRKLENLVARDINKRNEKGESYLKNSPYWILLEHKKAKVAIRINNENKKLELTSDIWGKENIPEKYINDVLEHVQEVKMHGAELLIAQFGKDPNKQIELAQSGEEKILLTLARNKNLHSRAQRFLCEGENSVAKVALAENPIITPEVQMYLVDTAGERVIERLASNPGIIPQVQYIIAEKGHDYAKMYLAENPRIVPDVQINLAESDIEMVQVALARNPSIAPQAEKILINSKDECVIAILAKNESISEQTQLTLVKEGDENVLKILADKEKLCPLAKLALAESPYPEVRELLSQRPNLSKEARKILETSGYSLQESKEDANQALRQGQTQSQGIAK